MNKAKTFALIGAIVELAGRHHLVESDGYMCNSYNEQTGITTQGITIDFYNDEHGVFDGEMCDVTVNNCNFGIRVSDDNIIVFFSNDKILNCTASFRGENIEECVSKMHIFLESIWG